MKILNVNDILEYRCPNQGLVWQWRVMSISLGGKNQESLIEIKPLTNTAGLSHQGPMPTTWVPEPMTRTLDVFRPNVGVIHDV